MKEFRKPSGTIVEVNAASESLALSLGWVPVDTAKKDTPPKAPNKPIKSK
jgi:hypothetical protein